LIQEVQLSSSISLDFSCQVPHFGLQCSFSDFLHLMQAAIRLAIPYCSESEYTSLSRIAWPWLSFVPGLAGRIGSSKPTSLLQIDYPIVKEVLKKL
jgi:hypothetical protein